MTGRPDNTYFLSLHKNDTLSLGKRIGGTSTGVDTEDGLPTLVGDRTLDDQTSRRLIDVAVGIFFRGVPSGSDAAPKTATHDVVVTGGDDVNHTNGAVRFQYGAYLAAGTTEIVAIYKGECTSATVTVR